MPETTLPAPVTPAALPAAPASPDAIRQAMEEAGVTTQDMVLAKLLLMQNTSEYVGAEKAKLGDIMHSIDLVKLGGPDEPIEIIPLRQFKTWRVYSMESGKPKFIREDAFDEANPKLPWEDKEAGQGGKTIPIRRDLNLNFYILLKRDVEREDAFPCVVSFKRTSTQAGRQLASHLVKMAALGRRPFANTMLLGVKKEKKDTNLYALFEIMKGNPTDDAGKAAADFWLSQMKVRTVVVDDKDDGETEPTAEAPATVSAKGPQF